MDDIKFRFIAAIPTDRLVEEYVYEFDSWAHCEVERKKCHYPIMLHAEPFLGYNLDVEIRLLFSAPSGDLQSEVLDKNKEVFYRELKEARGEKPIAVHEVELPNNEEIGVLTALMSLYDTLSIGDTVSCDITHADSFIQLVMHSLVHYSMALGICTTDFTCADGTGGAWQEPRKLNELCQLAIASQAVICLARDGESPGEIAKVLKKMTTLHEEVEQ